MPAPEVPVITVCPALIGSVMVGFAGKPVLNPRQVTQRSTMAVGHCALMISVKAQASQFIYLGSLSLTPEISEIFPPIAQVAETFVSAAYRKPVFGSISMLVVLAIL